MNELKFQGYLVDAALDIGGHAFKCNNQFMTGVSDLSVKLLRLPHLYIEAKRHSWLHGIKEAGLTPHQRKFLFDYRQAGGVAGWVTFAPAKGKRDCYDIYASADIGTLTHDVRIDFSSATMLYRARGEGWPITDIVKTIIAGQQKGTAQ